MIQLHDISARVDASVDQLRNWSHAIDATGYKHERLVVPGKHDRLLSKPADWLRPVLDKLATWFYESLTVHAAAHGYVAGRSILTHALQHVHAPAGPAWLVTLDLRDWFGTIKESRIAVALERARWAPDAAALVAKLCCERGHLPQGAPTSPVLANFCAYAFDHRLTQSAVAKGFVYSRFADDLAFSTAADVGIVPVKKLLTHIDGHAKRASFVIHPKKTQITRPWQQQDVTGLVVNGGRVRPARVMMRQIRAAIHNLAQGKSGEWTEAQIRGSIGFVQMVDKERGAKLLEAFQAAQGKILSPDHGLYWHCLQCGAHDPVEPTGGTEQDQYALGDHEPCITCGDGTAHVVTLRIGACYEQGRALGMDIRDAWERALKLRAGK